MNRTELEEIIKSCDVNIAKKCADWLNSRKENK